MPEKFKPFFSIPYFLLSYSPKTHSEKGSEKEENPSVFTTDTTDFRLKISFPNVHPLPVRWEDSNSHIVLLGSPILDGKIEKDRVLAEIATNAAINKDFIRRLNGEFLIFHLNKKTQKLTVCNDRFPALPFYYRHNQAENTFHGSLYFSDIWELLKKGGSLSINQEVFFEFFWFQRLLGTKTYAKDVFYLPDSSILEVKNNSLSISRYWQRNYQKSSLSLEQHAQKMADLTRQSVKQKAGDNKRYGLFLSGGMDSRIVLAAFSENIPVCFTLAISENRELRTARAVAGTKGAEHIFLELDPEHYGKILIPSVRITGGMYNYDHGLFLGYNDIIQKYADVCLHGHGFDYMFQGMYLPAKNAVIMGKTLYLKKLRKPHGDLASFFINNVSYRIKHADIWNFIVPEKAENLKSFQRESVSEILKKGKEVTDNVFDLWEYLTFHHFSRHYSHPNLATMATFAEQRTVSFDNELFDFYLSLPVEHRFNGRIAKKCLEILDPKLARIRNANTGLPITASSWKQTLYQAAGFLKRRICCENGTHPPWRTERTWPSKDYALRNQISLKNAVKELCDSNVLEQLGFLDMNKIRKLIPEWIEGKEINGVSGSFIQALLTAGTFLKQG